MESKLSSISSYISYGWEKVSFRKHSVPVLLVFLISAIIGFVTETVGSDVTGNLDALGDPERVLNVIGFVTSVAGWILGIITSIGFVKLGLYVADDRDFTFSTLFVHTWKELWKFVFQGLLLVLIVAIPALLLSFAGLVSLGLFTEIASTVSTPASVIIFVLGVCLLIFAVYFSVRVSFFLYFVTVDNADRMSVFASIRHTRFITKGHFWRIVGFSILTALVNLLGLLCLGVGLLWTVPLSQIAMAKFYRELADRDAKEESTIIA